MTTMTPQRAAALKALQAATDALEKRLEQLRWRERVAQNLASMTPTHRKIFLGAIAAKLNRIEREIAAAQATQAAQPRPVARKTAPAAQRPTATRISRQADELLRDSFARKSMPVGCSGPTCNRMRTPTGGRR